jgi:hypothetical protein
MKCGHGDEGQGQKVVMFLSTRQREMSEGRHTCGGRNRAELRKIHSSSLSSPAEKR